SEEQLVEYNLAPKNIRDCIDEVYTSEQVNAFDKRFRGTGKYYTLCDIIRFLSSGISGEEANAYDPRLYCNRILWLHDKGITGDQTHGFDLRFDNKRMGELLGLGVTGEQASSYDWSFHDITVEQLCESGIPNDVAAPYLPRFRWAKEIIALVEKNVPPEIAKAYEDRFDARTVATLYNAGYLPEQAATYSHHFHVGGIELLARHEIPPEIANLYNPERFSALEVHALIEAGVPPEIIDQYHNHFNGFSISFLWQAHINPYQANEYLEGFKPEEIVRLFSLGVTGETVPVKKQEQLKPILSTIATFREESVRYLDHGGYGVVLRLGQDLVIKVSQNVEAEAELLEKITKYHEGKQRHIARYKGFQKGVLVIEYIDGPSLEDYVLASDPLPDEEIVKYASHVLEGLIEMRKSGVIHHRDLKPRNIMIERKTKNAILVDVGVASTKRGTGKNRLFPRRGYNKGYGTHDLIALGQVLYFMATGEHLFSHSTSMLLSTGGKYDVRDEREKVYQNPYALLLPYFEKIKETVRNPLVQQLIKDCLTAQSFHFRKMQRKFAYALEHLV
ncbi:protein kinase, partial [Candidatus Woesearchaeota archaeon]|nr:protein kinase [Candidatus Woesearchaeota archaeon]